MTESTGGIDMEDDASGTIKNSPSSTAKRHMHDLRLESLEVVLISAAFDQDVSLVFADDGFTAQKGPGNQGGWDENFSPTYRALEGYDIEKLYVEKESMEARGLTADDLIVDVEVLVRLNWPRCSKSKTCSEFLGRDADVAHR